MKRSTSIPLLFLLVLALPGCTPSSLSSWAQTAPTVPQVEWDGGTRRTTPEVRPAAAWAETRSHPTAF